MIKNLENWFQEQWQRRHVITGYALKYAKRFSELLGLLFALWLLVAHQGWLRMVDPTAAAIDAGAISLLLYGAVAFLIANTLFWVVLYLNWPKVYKYLDNELENDLNKYSAQCENRVRNSIRLFSVLYLSAVACMVAALLAL